MQCKLVIVVLFIVLLSAVDVDCKRSSGRSRSSSSRSSTSFWTSNSKKKSESNNVAKPKPPANPDLVALSYPKQTGSIPTNNKPKPSAPKVEPPQQTQQRPIGWDVPQQPQTKTVMGHQQQSGHLPGYPAASGYNAYGQGPPVGPPPPYSPPGYGQPAYGGHYQPPPNYNAQQPFPGHYPTSNMGMVPPHGGPYYNQMAGTPNGGGSGMFGSFLGGRSSGYGGGYGMGGFGGGMMGPKRSFGSGFASTAFTSLATGLLVWSLMRGGRSQYYNVYNHYNHPEAVPAEIALPASAIRLCPENVTMLCAPSTVPLCTANETILCAVAAASTVPCADGRGCVDTPAPQGAKENRTLTLPCIANATVSGQVQLEAADKTMSLFGSTPPNAETVLCVTTMAMPSPEEEAAAAKAAVEQQAPPNVSTPPSAANQTTSR